MIRLVRKELLQLIPIAYLWLAVYGISYLVQFFTERLDEQTFGGWCSEHCDVTPSYAVTIVIMLITLVTAYSLFPREHDDSTVDFLRALPVSRRSIFIAKFLSAWILLIGLNFLGYGTDYFLLHLNPQSISGRFYPEVWGSLLLRDCLFAFVVLSHGILLSWFRTLGLIIYGLYFLLVMLFESSVGSAGLISVFQFMTNEYHGSTLILNYKAIGVHLGVACLCLFIAYQLWNRSDSARTGGKLRKRSTRIWQTLGGMLAFIAIAIVIVGMIDRETGGSTATELDVTTTEHFRFVYNKDRVRTVSYMLDHAENDFEKLGEILGVASLPNVRVDLSAQSEHAAGLAKWKKIQMDLDAFRNDVSQRRVLVHEAAHVLQAVESDRAFAANYGATRFFIEGMAQYVSFLVVPETARRNSNWELAAIAWKRQHIEFNDLIDESSFSQRFDPELHYSLGDMWTAALVDTCGESILGDILRAAGRDGAPLGLPATLFWRDTMREVRCELDTVNMRWRELLSDIHDSVDARRFPEFDKLVVSRNSELSQVNIRASLEPFVDDDILDESIISEMRFSVRLSGSAQIAATSPRVFRGSLEVDEETRQPYVSFSIPDYLIPGNRFRYQLGLTPSRDSRYYYDSWRSGSAVASSSN